MSSAFNFRKVDFLEPFVTHPKAPPSPAPRGTDILSTCILKDADASNPIPQALEDFLVASFFSNGTLALKRISSNQNSSAVFQTAVDSSLSSSGSAAAAPPKRKLGQHISALSATGSSHHQVTSTLAWEDLANEGYFSKNNNNSFPQSSILGMTFNNGTATVQKILSSHVDVGVITPQLQEVINHPPQRDYADQEQIDRDDDDDDSNSDENSDSNNQETPQRRQSPPQPDDENDDGSNNNNVTTNAFSPPQQQPRRQQNQTGTFPLQDASTNNNNNATNANIRNTNNTNNQTRYIAVGAALCELSDGRCALFTVSTNVSNRDLLKGLLNNSAKPTTQQQKENSSSSSTSSTQQQQEPQLPCYPIDAESSILELPSNCLSVEVQVSTASVLIRAHSKNNNPIKDGDSSSCCSTMICLALDSSGRPVGAASLRGRSLGQFSSGNNMSGIRALWRIHRDGSCSGNMESGAGGILENWVLGGGSGGSGNKNAAHKRNQQRQQQLATFGKHITHQNHQIIAAMWLDHNVILQGMASSKNARRNSPLTNNINTSFSCLSVLLSEWKEMVPTASSASSSSLDNNSSNNNAGGAFVSVERSLCTVLLSQMVSSDPAGTLRGFTHRKICTFRKPSESFFHPASRQGGSNNSATAALTTSATINGDGTLMLLASPSMSKVSIAVVIMTTNTIPARATNIDAEEPDNNNNDELSSTVTFDVICSHSHQRNFVVSPQMHFTSKKSVAVFLPSCGCCATVQDVLRVPPTITASPILGDGCADSPLDLIGLRNTEKFPVVPRLARFAVCHQTNDGGNNNNQQYQKQQMLLNQTSFLEQVVSDTTRNDHHPNNTNNNNRSQFLMNHYYANNNNNASASSSTSSATTSVLTPAAATPFVFLGLPTDVDSNSGSAATLVYSQIAPNPSNTVNAQQSSSLASLFYSTTGGRSSSSSSPKQQQENAQRLVNSLSAESIFISYQLRNLEYEKATTHSSSSSSASTTTSKILLQAGVALLENYFKRANLVLTICNNLFTKTQEQVHLFANIALEVSQHCDSLLASFEDCFDVALGGPSSVCAGAANNNNNNASSDQINASTSAISLLHALNEATSSSSNHKTSTQHNQQKTRPKMSDVEESVAHLVATTFVSTVTKLLQLGLVSVASRVAHAVGPYCSYVVDLVYPSALQLYRQSNISPGYASYLHDIENLVSDEGKDVVRALEKIRMGAMKRK